MCYESDLEKEIEELEAALDELTSMKNYRPLREVLPADGEESGNPDCRSSGLHNS